MGLMINKKKFFISLLVTSIFVFITYTQLLSKYYNPKRHFTIKDYFYSNNSSSCSLEAPQFSKLRFSHTYWQVQELSNSGKIYLLSAYYDNRLQNINNLIRIFAMVDGNISNSSLFCILRYNSSKFERVLGDIVRAWGLDSYYESELQPYMISCPIDLYSMDNIDKDIPISVSVVVKNDCSDITNSLDVVYNRFKRGVKEDFVVCVKGLYYEDEEMIYRLIEWIELLYIIGANKLHFYKFSVPPNIDNMLNYYKTIYQNKFEVTPISYISPDNSRIELPQKRLHEVLIYDDCLYKHLHQFKFVVLLDVDEIIIPTYHKSWKLLIQDLTNYYPKNVATFFARHFYFLDNFNHTHTFFEDIPRFMHMLQHVYRSANASKFGYYVKGFHDVEKVVTLHNHLPFRCFKEKCKMQLIPNYWAQLQHYRKECKDLWCDEFKRGEVLDANVWRYKEQLMARVFKVLKALQL